MKLTPSAQPPQKGYSCTVARKTLLPPPYPFSSKPIQYICLFTFFFSTFFFIPPLLSSIPFFILFLLFLPPQFLLFSVSFFLFLFSSPAPTFSLFLNLSRTSFQYFLHPFLLYLLLFCLSHISATLITRTISAALLQNRESISVDRNVGAHMHLQNRESISVDRNT